MQRVKDKVCIVTGGALGIGRACAERLGEEGGRVAIFDMLDAQGEALVHALQARGIGTAIVSASRNAGTILRAAGVDDLFEVRVDGVVAEQLHLPGKPAPAMFLEAAKRLEFKPEEFKV